MTLDLLKEAGYRYVMDWPIDDQPIWMRTRAGPILSVPYPIEINNSPALVIRRHTGRQFAEMVIDQFDEMLEQSRKYPLVFSVAVHPFIIGQPFRLRAVPPCDPPHHGAPRRAVDHDARRDRALLRGAAEGHRTRVELAQPLPVLPALPRAGAGGHAAQPGGQVAASKRGFRRNSRRNPESVARDLDFLLLRPHAPVAGQLVLRRSIEQKQRPCGEPGRDQERRDELALNRCS